MPTRRSIVLALAATALPGLPFPAMAAPRPVADAGALKAALTASTGGETLALAPGVWPALQLRGLRFEKPVTLTAADPGKPPELRGLDFRDCAGLMLRGLHLRYVYSSGDAWKVTPFNVSGSTGISFTDCRFTGDGGEGTVTAGKGTFDITGAPWGSGIRIRKSDDCHVIRCTVTGFRQGVVLNQARGASVQNCRVERSGNDNMRIIEVSDLLIEGNYLGQQDSHPDEPFHNDHIHHFNNHATTPSERVTIRRNILFSTRSAKKDSAGMMLQNYQDAPLADWRIEENLVIGRAKHGISLWPSTGSVIRNNTLLRWHSLQSSDQTKFDFRIQTPQLNLRKGSSGARIEDNITALKIFGKPRAVGEVSTRGNVVIAPAQYATAFTMPDPENPLTWRVRPGGPAVGKGSPLMW